MEASSPLAAMHRPMPASPWSGKDLFRSHSHSHSHSHYASASAAGRNSYREHSAKGSSDFFLARELRGSSSPAATLAADLSQNFSIEGDFSPRCPTPRRALFTANMMGGGSGRRRLLSTPMASSSPAPLTEILDMSPLPHRAPFSSLLDISSSPSPTSTAPPQNFGLESPAPFSRSSPLLVSHSSPLVSRSSPLVSRSSPLEPAKANLLERRPSAHRRSGGSSRLKGLLASSMSKSFSSSDTQLPTTQPKKDFNSSALSLEECFASSSPVADRSMPVSSNSPCPSIPTIRSRPQFAGVGGGSGRHGSPSSSFYSRRSSNPFLRTRKQLRRSLSMFESPADVMKAKPEPQPSPLVLKTINDMEEPHEPILPHFMADDPTDTIPRITKETMLEILDGKYNDRYHQKMVIDCRFEYEYDGGHIDGAVNHNDKDMLSDRLFQKPLDGTTLLIFHCEYSAHRAPLMARHIRSQDRTINAENYPRLTYPEVYILDGGYSGFWAQHSARCFPPEYVEMSDEKHQRTCEREMGRLKARKPFGRAQTFAAFSKREPGVFDSPTGPSKPSTRNTSVFDRLGDFSPLCDDRTRTRRLASYS